MAETNPASPEVTQAEAVDARLERFLGVSDEPAAPGDREARATPDLPADELAPDDIEPGDEPVDEEGYLEFQRNGETKRVSKEEARKLAAMGFDATEKWQAAAEAQRQNTEFRQALNARLSIHPQIIDAAATLKSVATALQPYQQVDWVRLSQDDPIAYSQHRAKFDQLREVYGQAAGTFQNVAQQAQNIEQQIDQGALVQQARIAMEKLPEWRDPQRRAADQGRIRQYLLTEGIADQELNMLTDARHLVIARKAMLYDQAMRAKQGRQVQDSPSLRPGAAPPRASERVKTGEIIKQLHQAKDPDKKKGLLDAALERKMARFIR